MHLMDNRKSFGERRRFGRIAPELQRPLEDEDSQYVSSEVDNDALGSGAV